MSGMANNYSFERLRWAFTYYPQRLYRLIQRTTWQHPLDACFVVLDLLLVLDAYELLLNWVKPQSRAMNSGEKFLARMVFGDRIPLHLVRIDESARLGTQTTGIVYVSGFTINSWGSFSEGILVHELVHVWQYQTQGAAYIPRALRAQRSPMGYNYGGLTQLRLQPDFHQYNLEQQADIVMDYFLLLQGRPASWAPEASGMDVDLYEQFVDQIRQNRSTEKLN